MYNVNEIRENMIKYMRSNPNSMRHFALGVGVAHDTLTRFVKEDVPVRLETLLKIQKFLDDNEKLDI